MRRMNVLLTGKIDVLNYLLLLHFLCVAVEEVNEKYRTDTNLCLRDNNIISCLLQWQLLIVYWSKYTAKICEKHDFMFESLR